VKDGEKWRAEVEKTKIHDGRRTVRRRISWIYQLFP
jgi:hypothetical protein